MRRFSPACERLSGRLLWDRGLWRGPSVASLLRLRWARGLAPHAARPGWDISARGLLLDELSRSCCSLPSQKVVALPDGRGPVLVAPRRRVVLPARSGGRRGERGRGSLRPAWLPAASPTRRAAPRALPRPRRPDRPGLRLARGALGRDARQSRAARDSPRAAARARSEDSRSVFVPRWVSSACFVGFWV